MAACEGVEGDSVDSRGESSTLAGGGDGRENRGMAIKVVAFDVYDTLARWPEGRVEPIEVARLLGRFGVEISYQAYEAARQGVMFFDGAKRPIEGWIDFLALTFAKMGAKVSVDLIASVAAMCESRNRMEVFPDALGAVEAVKAAGLTACAFTTLPRFMFRHGGEAILSRLDHYFDAAATGYAKGHPRFYARVTELLGVRPEEILCVGDDLICDVELPQAAGWRAVWLDRKGSGNESTEYQRANTLVNLSQFWSHDS
jgi:FMN phosphatase YigB (HAD superfamily)